MFFCGNKFFESLLMRKFLVCWSVSAFDSREAHYSLIVSIASWCHWVELWNPWCYSLNNSHSTLTLWHQILPSSLFKHPRNTFIWKCFYLACYFLCRKLNSVLVSFVLHLSDEVSSNMNLTRKVCALHKMFFKFRSQREPQKS